MNQATKIIIQSKIKKTHDKFKMPNKGSKYSACYDVYATSKKDYGDGRIEYGLGFAMSIPEGTQLDLRARSSIHKTGMILSNGIGTGDSDYTGEYKAVFYKIIKELPDYEIGDRILQIQGICHPYLKFECVDELSKTDRGDGGFGSTGN